MGVLKNDATATTKIEAKCEKHDEEKFWPQYLAILIVALGSFSTGIIFVWSSPFSLVIVQDKETYNITEDDTSYFIFFQPVGMLFGSVFMFRLTEYLGRKKSLLFLAVPHLACWIAVIFATSKWHFYLSRFIGGIGDSCLFCTIPPYVGEITTPAVRGTGGNAPTFCLYGGQLLVTVLGSFLDVRTSAYICIGFPVLYVLLVSLLLPESPYQLIRDKKFDKARQSIKWLIRKRDIEQDFLSMKADVERQMSETGTWKDLFVIPSNRRALRAVGFLRISQQFCGIATFASYTQPIFEKAGGSISPQLSSIIFMALIWVLNLFCSASVEKFGRKPSYLYSVLSCGLILITMAVYFFLEQYQLADLSALNWFPLAGMVLYVFTYSFGLGVVPTLMLGEIFSASIKSKGLSALIALFGLAVFVSNNLFNILTSYVGLFCPYLVYGICCLVSTILTRRWVPETKGKTLEEIQQTLKK